LPALEKAAALALGPLVVALDRFADSVAVDFNNHGIWREQVGGGRLAALVEQRPEGFDAEEIVARRDLVDELGQTAGGHAEHLAKRPQSRLGPGDTGVVEEDFTDWMNGDSFERLAAALRRRIIVIQCRELITKEVEADGLGRAWRKKVDDTTAHREGALILAEAHTLVAAADEVANQRFAIDALASYVQLARGCERHPWHDATQEGRRGRHDDTRALSSKKPVAHHKALRHQPRIGRDFFERRMLLGGIDGDVGLAQSPKLVRQVLGLLELRCENEQRTPGELGRQIVREGGRGDALEERQPSSYEILRGESGGARGQAVLGAKREAQVRLVLCREIVKPGAATRTSTASMADRYRTFKDSRHSAVGLERQRKNGCILARAKRRAYTFVAMLAERIAKHEEAPPDDHIVVLRNAAWSDYQRALELRGDRPVPRLAYIKGVLQLMSPSQDHEAIKSLIGRLVEVWCLERNIEFSPFGAWTLENKEAERGVEPDECYVFGSKGKSATRPDLAIEVIWTSGGVDKREIYQALGVRELWFWRRGRLTIHALRTDRYEEVAASEVLSGIDLGELVTFIDRPTASQAIREYRAVLQQKGPS
jgi:Uma2 family endonuclease